MSEEKQKEIEPSKVEDKYKPKPISKEEWDNDFAGTDEDNSMFYP